MVQYHVEIVPAGGASLCGAESGATDFSHDPAQPRLSPANLPIVQTGDSSAIQNDAAVYRELLQDDHRRGRPLSPQQGPRKAIHHGVRAEVVARASVPPLLQVALQLPLTHVRA